MHTDYEFDREAFELPADFEDDEELSRFQRLPTRSRVSVSRPIAPRANAPRPQPVPPRKPRYPRRIIGRRTYLYAPESPAATEYVRWVQTMLNQALNLQLPVDGVMTVQTRSAIRSFQEKNSLPVTGIVGPDTERVLQSGNASGAPASTAPEPVAPVEDQPTDSEWFEAWPGEFEFAGDAFTVLPTGATGSFKDWVWPMPVWNGRNPVISNGFDPSPDPTFGKKHGGVDIMYKRLPDESAKLPDGTKGFFVPSDRIPVYAVANGVVIQSGKNPLGHSVIIDHGNGYTTFYQHLTAQGLPAKSTRVTAGMPIGIVGHNPAGYTLNHLHFEIWPGGSHARSIDPASVLRGRSVPHPSGPPTPSGGATTSGQIVDAVRRGAWTAVIRLKIQSGERDENRLTDFVFFARHPERNGQRLQSHEQPLIQEWLEIRERLVRPALS
jgi:murein DD-endopeptidase MepM/ murein hydrolase activator NlpD